MTLHHITLYYIMNEPHEALACIILQYSTLHYTLLHCMLLYYMSRTKPLSALHYIILHYIKLNIFALHCLGRDRDDGTVQDADSQELRRVACVASFQSGGEWSRASS